MSRLKVAAILACLSGTAVNGEPVQWTKATGGNGHYYDVVTFTGDVFPSWYESRDLAATMSWQDKRGHLATLTSAEEDAWVCSTFHPQRDLCYLGGFQELDAPEPAGGWQWVTGEPWDYTNWGGGAPNDNTDEDVLHFHGPLWPCLWNDARAENIGNGVPGFVIEYESVEVPAMGGLGFGVMAVLLVGAATIVLIRRRVAAT